MTAVDRDMPLGAADPRRIEIVDVEGRALFRVSSPPGSGAVLIEFASSGEFIVLPPGTARRLGEALALKAIESA